MSQSDGLSDVARKGNRLATLRALRDRLAREIDSATEAYQVVQLAAQMSNVLAQIEVCEKAQPETKGTVLDELNAKRAEREAASPRRTSRSK